MSDKNEPTAPISPFALPMPMLDEGLIYYYFKIQRRNFWCYKNYLKLEIIDNYYVIDYDSGILKIPRTKSQQDIIDIMRTIGIKNKNFYKVYVMSDNSKLSKKYLYDLNSIINFVNKTELIMCHVKYS